MYRPKLINAQPVRRYTFHDHTGVLLTDVTARTTIQYRHALVVWRNDERDPCLFVTAEVSTSDPIESFFCIFDDKGHYNQGASIEWNSLERFEEQALEVLMPRVGPPVSPSHDALSDTRSV